MFGFKKKGKIFASQNGRAVALSEVPDPAFSEKMLGDGVAIIPEDDTVLSPVNGTVVDVTNTLHAYCIQTDDGLDVLIHIGINTVELKGEGFKSLVKSGDKVKAGQPLAQADIKFLKDKGYQIYTPILITNMDAVNSISVSTGNTQAGKSCVITYSCK